jgi:ketosteroid isomerase-like protein
MSNDEEIIAGLRRFYEAFNRGDFDAVEQHVDPDIELVRTGGMSSVKGIAALRAWMQPDAIEEQRIEPLEFTVNGNKVLVRHHATGRGAGSGIPLDFVFCGVLTVDEDGLLTQAQAFLPHEEAEALEAAGLSE